MSKKFAFKIIDQASKLKVPSMKFNWRGEPLLNPALPEIIDYAKKSGVLETIINTNATKLNFEMSNKIIDSVRFNDLLFLMEVQKKVMKK